MSPAYKARLDVMRYIDAVDAYVVGSILLDHTRVGARRPQYSDVSLARVSRHFLVKEFSMSLIDGSRSSNSTFISGMLAAQLTASVGIVGGVAFLSSVIITGSTVVRSLVNYDSVNRLLDAPMW